MAGGWKPDARSVCEVCAPGRDGLSPITGDLGQHREGLAAPRIPLLLNRGLGLEPGGVLGPHLMGIYSSTEKDFMRVGGHE